ncbi:endo-1,4-beta-xylanase [Streptomyces carpaticus]|uniref:Beta-xylanase n=1 Tax=Streptomyces carpaticus TaxID=285558 RepID=A0ABV4ZSV5_9ACTN
MFSQLRRAAVVVATGVLLSGAALHGGAQAAPTTTDEAPSAQLATLREAASTSGKFIGTAVADHRLSDATYSGIAAREFSSVTAENVMKWESIQPQRGSFNWAGPDRLMQFAQANDQQVYGHTLVWHSQMPGWLANGNFGATEMNQIMNTHISTVMGRYQGQINRWDVVNEAFNEDGTLRNSKWLQVLGPDYIANAFRAARAADPDAKLFINDYNTDGINAKSTGLYNLVRDLRAQGVPIDGVGFQSHLILDQLPSDYQANLQRFADLGVEVVVTELDIRMRMPSDAAKLERQSQQFARVVQACLNVSRCSGVTVWGFSDRDSWVPGTFPGEGAALPYDDNYQPKPAYNGILTAFGGDPGGGDPGPGPGPGADCTAAYQVANRWNAGSVVDVRVTARQALNGWTVTFTLPTGESVTSHWNTQLTQSGTTVTARNVAHNAAIPAGGTLNFGFQTNSGAVYSAPVVSLNGTACAAATG